MIRNIVVGPKADWAKASWKALLDSGYVSFYDDIIEKPVGLTRFLFKISKSLKTKALGLWFIQRFFAKRVIKHLGLKKHDDIAIIVYDYGEYGRFYRVFDFIKRRFNCKLGYLFTNIVDESSAKKSAVLSKIDNIFDKVFVFDKSDQKLNSNYEMSYLVYNPVINNDDKPIEYDAFLIAKSKNRLSSIIDAFDRMVVEGLNVCFYVNSIPDQDIKKLSERDIKANVVLPYSKVVECISKSKCIVDIMQKNSKGITLNVVEAVFYEKKVITDNTQVISEPFYNETRFFVLGLDERKLIDFINCDMLPYSAYEKELFSGKKLFNKIRNK